MCMHAHIRKEKTTSTCQSQPTHASNTALTMPLVASPPTNRVILGLMTFGPDESAGARITTVDAFAEVLDLFQARGYHEVDTARVYVDGAQEAFTRAAGWQTRGLTLATKVAYPRTPGTNTADKVAASVAASLDALGTECVDLLYLHAADRGTPFAATLAALDALHRAGKFVRWGLSNFAAFEVAEVCLLCQRHGWVRPSVYQGMYNVLTRALEPELVPACRRYGLDIVVYNPVAGGLFSGKIKSRDLTPADGRFSDTAASGRLYRGRYFRESTFRALQVVEKAVEAHGLSMIETALRWMVHHSALRLSNTNNNNNKEEGGDGGGGGNDGIIIGVSSREQLAENLDHLEKGPLPEALVQKLDEAWLISKADTAPYWHGEIKYHYDPKEVLFGAK